MRQDDRKLSPPLSASEHAHAEHLVSRGDLLFARGDFQQAHQHFAEAIRIEPAVAGHFYRAGLTLWRMGAHEAAKDHLQRAIELKSDFAHAHGELGRVLLALGQIESALIHSRRAVELEPADPTLAVALASVLEADTQRDAARIILDRLIAAGHESTDLAMVYSRSCLRRDSAPRALALIDRLLSRTPPISVREQSALHFSAANLNDSLGKFDAAFAHASKANALRGAAYNPEQTAISFQNFINYFTREKLRNSAPSNETSDVPIFIVGMPRAGTSLVEQILASHPAVHGAGELAWIARVFETAVQKAARGGTPSLEWLDVLSPDDMKTLAHAYLDPLRTLNPSARYITDKMPTNFIYLGFIAMLFPKAKIIHCRRDPHDTCLSCFMTDFTAGYEFSFSLPSSGHFYRQYDRMMSHWKSAIDLPMLDVDYEEVVADIEGQTRRMLAFLDLPWDENCLRFHESKRFVGTASHALVRLPLYRSSVGRWKNYDKWLMQLHEALKP